MPADQSGSVLESGSLIVDGLWLMLRDSLLRFTTTRETESQHDDDRGVVNTTHPNEKRGNLRVENRTGQQAKPSNAKPKLHSLSQISTPPGGHVVPAGYLLD